MSEQRECSLRSLRKAYAFYERNKNLFTSQDAFRKQLERRDVNGLAQSGAVVETALGLMIDPAKFRLWLLQPAEFRPRRLEARAAA